MTKLSAGILMYRTQAGVLEVLLAHPGGPFWEHKDEGAWSIPKGEYTEGDDPLEHAKREFEEEIGTPPPAIGYVDLGEIKQPSGKTVACWAVAGTLDAATIQSNSFEMEWPRGSGHMKQFPEVDRADWFSLAVARSKLLKGQVGFLDRLESHLQSQPAG